MGRNDQPGLAELLCDDFHAFENGVPMARSELLALIDATHAAGKRYRWSVKEPQVEAQGDFGAVVYRNEGFISETPDAEPAPASWLETVLLRRVRTGWRVAFLHSTRTPSSTRS